ncbi:hypothetical protein RRG08_058317 [Elysia crispata]|uniref:Uncharacterized protein n=1 Tax=Elysia crispata TaxID=231223 RepID=A0AAE1D5X7_9GAST|nr:hypothetical protein RRG08_058317 [Elysia crispata]
MCKQNRHLEEYMKGAKIIAYLIEVDPDLQMRASITDHLRTTLQHYLHYTDCWGLLDISLPVEHRVLWLSMPWAWQVPIRGMAHPDPRHSTSRSVARHILIRGVVSSDPRA